MDTGFLHAKADMLEARRKASLLKEIIDLVIRNFSMVRVLEWSRGKKRVLPFWFECRIVDRERHFDRLLWITNAMKLNALVQSMTRNLWNYHTSVKHELNSLLVLAITNQYYFVFFHRSKQSRKLIMSQVVLTCEVKKSWWMGIEQDSSLHLLSWFWLILALIPLKR